MSDVYSPTDTGNPATAAYAIAFGRTTAAAVRPATTSNRNAPIAGVDGVESLVMGAFYARLAAPLISLPPQNIRFQVWKLARGNCDYDGVDGARRAASDQQWRRRWQWSATLIM